METFYILRLENFKVLFKFNLFKFEIEKKKKFEIGCGPIVAYLAKVLRDLDSNSETSLKL